MRPANIFVIDDSNDVREIIEIMLTHAGFAVHTFSNAVDARAAMAKLKVDLFLVDVVLPHMSGTDFVQALDVKNSDYEVIIMTGKTDRKGVLASLESGAISYMLKPFKYEVLLAKVKEALEALAAKRAREFTDNTVPLPA